MTENNYSYVIECGKTKFYKNGKFMTSSEVLNELKVKDMIINQFSEENNELKLQLEAFKDKLCELGVSDVKLYGKRYYTGLEERLDE